MNKWLIQIYEVLEYRNIYDDIHKPYKLKYYETLQTILKNYMSYQPFCPLFFIHILVF